MIIFSIVLLWIFYRLFINKSNNNFEKWLIILWIISFILALWNSSNNIFSNISNFLYQYFPFYKWFREPHKWIMFLVIVYAYFWAYWIQYIKEFLDKKNVYIYLKRIFLLCLILLPIIYSSKTIWWFSWQITIKNYPNEWEEIKDLLQNNKNINCNYLNNNLTTKCYETLIFPRHWYIWIKWIKKIVWWWIVNYFWDNILFWDNIEIWDVYSSSNRKETKIIEKYIWPNWLFKKEILKKEELENFINDLKWIWIKNIIFLKEADYKNYEIIFIELLKNNFIKIEKENKMIILYKIN